MQFVRYTIALAGIVASTSGLAVPPAGKHVDTPAELVELCSVSKDDPAYTAAMGFCLGYIDAALDYHAALTSGKNFDPIVCPDAAVTREEVMTMFLNWSKGNPQHVGTGLPVEGVMRAVHEKWPCCGP